MADDSCEKDRRFDLEERTAIFGEQVIRFAKSLPRNVIARPLISQLIRSGTSIGANYAEANDAGTRKEFFHRVSICQRESRESMHWLRMLAVAVPECKESGRSLWKEAKELNCIFAAIHRKQHLEDKP
jgi:four helix bundle protein